MTKAYSLAFKQKMVERLTGKNAQSPSELGREIGIRQQNLSRWLQEARSLPLVASNTPKSRVWTVERKARVLADASKLNGEELTSHLERELARKEKALAEAAVLLVLKKTIDSYYKEEDDDTDEPSEKSS
jgi:transposase